MTTAPNTFVTWNASWNIGVHVIDAQHKNLVLILNQLHEAMSRGQARNILARTLDSLIRYTQAHFATEERLMQQSGYPDLIAHTHEHELLTAKVLEFQRSFEAGSAGLGDEIMLFLGEWLRSHIQGSDRLYVPFVQPNGVGDIRAVK